MALKTVAREKQTDTGIKVEHIHEEATTTIGNDAIHMDSDVFVLHRLAEAVASEDTSEDFTREVFEGALDKVSRPTGRGKFAHLRPNSEEFARRKQEEIDLEERSQ